MNIKKNKATKAMCAALAVAALTGVSAYFTDREEYQATAKAGNVEIVTTAFAGANENDILVDRDGKNNLNPGDVRDLTFTVTNKGNKAIDLRHTLMLTVTDENGDKLNLTDANGEILDQTEFEIYKKGDVTYTAAAGYVIEDGAVPAFSSTQIGADGNGTERTVVDNTIKYRFGSTTLLGGADAGVDSEREENAALTASSDVTGHINVDDDKDAVTYEYVLVFRGSSENRFMNCGVQVDMVVEAKQHYNTNNSWAQVAQQSFTAGSITQDAVPNWTEDKVGTPVSSDNGSSEHAVVHGEAEKNLLG